MIDVTCPRCSRSSTSDVEARAGARKLQCFNCGHGWLVSDEPPAPLPELARGATYTHLALVLRARGARVVSWLPAGEGGGVLTLEAQGISVTTLADNDDDLVLEAVRTLDNLLAAIRRRPA